MEIHPFNVAGSEGVSKINENSNPKAPAKPNCHIPKFSESTFLAAVLVRMI
ncbi:hypothetical protein GCM10008018_57290 [Paenibacillus marchantiophytorum]|uniref:Uncharacterized protein n=1 Tax=Paenibacillus marchantiophytorum TaxID=1619310 RepID=A0ABQ1F9G1_9BACL|nr:hypothetical protein GCM10008018_57290 [Paenibacillus marchantiophytorum]